MSRTATRRSAASSYPIDMPAMPPPMTATSTSRSTRSVFAECPGQLVPAHLRPAGEVAPLGDLVQLGPRLRARPSGALALGDRRALLAERGARRLRHVRDRLLAACG